MNLRERDANADVVVKFTDKIILTNNKIPEFGCEGDVAREATRTKEFSFNYIFWSVDQDDPNYCSQEKVFQEFGTDIVSSAYDGYNACAFAYGQPGSGKTYTMIGTQENRGLIPRICDDIFLKMNDQSATYRTEISFMEIYNERVRDLLETPDRAREGLRVREHPKCTAPTNMNDVSSRSHAIFTLIFTQARIFNGMPYETQSRIHLVDLAGSESADASGATGQRLKEGGNINRSLVTLGTVITLLAKSSDTDIEKKVFIPYRNSKLTWLLKDSLGGNSRTFMIATISPADINYNETLRTLRYAVGAKNIVNKPTKNEDPSVRLIREMKEEISRLKAMLGGELDKSAEPRVKEMLQESEVRVKVLTEEWTEKWHETDIADHAMAVRKEGKGIMLDSAHPHLIGIDDDIFSTGITMYNLKVGITTIGRNDAPIEQDIKIAGLDIEKEHCAIANDNNVVQLIPKNAAMCTLNGCLIMEPTKLTQGAVILLGKTNMFRFNNPAEAIKMKEELKDHGISVSREPSIGYGRSISDMYRSTDSLTSANWETSDDYGDDIDKLNEQRKYIELMEQRYDKAQTERESSISNLDQEVHNILVTLGDIKDRIHQDNMQNTKYGKGMKKLTDDHMKAKDAILQEITKLKSDLEFTMKSLDDEILILEQKENDLVISQITLQTNVHSKMDYLLKSKGKNMKDLEESDKDLQKLEQCFKEEKAKIASNSDVNERILRELEQQEQKIQTDVDIELKLLRDKRTRAESTKASEMRKIDEAWQDIREHEQQISEQKMRGLNQTEKSKLLQKQTHINEAKELLIQEQEAISKDHTEVMKQIEKEEKKIDLKRHKLIEEFQLKKQNVLSTISPKLTKINNKIYIKKKDLDDLDSTIQNWEKELENLEGMLSMSTDSCTKQQHGIAEETLNKKEKRDLKEQELKSKLSDLESRLDVLNKEFNESSEKLKCDLNFPSHQGYSDKTSSHLKQEEITKFQELYDKKHSNLLILKQQAEEQQDREFESLELEIMKLEEIQNQARIDQEVKRRLRDVRQNKATKRRNYESFASLETDYNIDGTSLASSTLTNVSGIGVNVSSFSLRNRGSDSFYEFEVQLVIGKDNWTVYRRYSKFREMHKELRQRIPKATKGENS
ncbi:kinesin-like protein KIF16B [Mytilus californianus]|uniref:kinesin-like protein KIF16B n=1 Tax=Mytilus californianus TaxID=6549 RepID=UPI002246C652|nr:kinesin-like protein KIF16B [Mytilus californianus]